MPSEPDLLERFRGVESGPVPLFDLVIVHEPPHWQAAFELGWQLADVADRPYRLWVKVIGSGGVAQACNDAAKRGDAPFVGVLSAPAAADGPFLAAVEKVFDDPLIAVTGCRVREAPDPTLDDWVSLAAFFTRRGVWGALRGLHEGFRRSHADVDFVRRLARHPSLDGARVRSIDLPLTFAPPPVDDGDAVRYRRRHP